MPPAFDDMPDVIAPIPNYRPPDKRQPDLPPMRMARNRQRDSRRNRRENLWIMREGNDWSVIGNLLQRLFNIRMASPCVSKSCQPKCFSLTFDFDRLIIKNSDASFFKGSPDASGVIPPVV